MCFLHSDGRRFLITFNFVSHAQSASPQKRSLITERIDESKRITLWGNVRSEATTENDRGVVADDLLMGHLLLQLRRSPEQERALEQFMDELQDPARRTFINGSRRRHSGSGLVWRRKISAKSRAGCDRTALRSTSSTPAAW